MACPPTGYWLCAKGFARFRVSTTEDSTTVDLGWDARLLPPERSGGGLVLAEAGLAADKMLAVTGIGLWAGPLPHLSDLEAHEATLPDVLLRLSPDSHIVEVSKGSGGFDYDGAGSLVMPTPALFIPHRCEIDNHEERCRSH